ncbi:6,7-dimethyl-8-ribityllumazine synthase [Acidimicrobiaceae bacterium]|nr:6,7-dimethyl-8-ribityllumazine synthase [Acidimicrobiaceae bacterium]
MPGAYEVPLAARVMAMSGRYEVLVALGAVIRGDTAHFEYVAGPCADGIARVQQDTGLPIGFAVLTPKTLFKHLSVLDLVLATKEKKPRSAPSKCGTSSKPSALVKQTI